MRQHLLALLAATALATAVPAVAAAQSINERQATLDARIDAGVRSGGLTNAEAAQLRAEFADLARLEARYRVNGLTAAERADLDRRFDILQQRIRLERTDRDDRGDRYDRDDRGGQGGGNINQRQRELEARIEEGVRNRTLTRNEAYQLRTELEAIERIEAQYRASGGLSQVERQYLDRRIDLLDRRLRTDRRDEDRRWTQLDARQAQFDRQLDQAVRERRLSEREAYNLRMEFRAIARLERQYRNSRPGITQAERLDLNRRFDRMEANLRAASSPTDNLFEMLFGLIEQR